MDATAKKEWLLLGVGALLVVLALVLPLPFWGKLAFYIAAYLCCGVEVLLTSFDNLRRGELFDENFLMTLATLGAFAIGEYPEGVSVMLFYQIGEKLQHRAAGTSRQKITALMDLRPHVACLVQTDGTVQEIDPACVQPGQTVRVRPGQRIPLDGRVSSGQSQVDTSSLTGEARPVVVTPGKEVWAGTINLEGTLEIQVTRTYAHSAVAQILQLAEHAASKKSNTEKFITRFARIYTPLIVCLALCLAVVPPLFLGASWHDWVYRALVFLVVSCPCALVLSVPLGFFGGIGGGAKHGVLIKGGIYLEHLARLATVCFDKTGTLTQGVFEITQISPADECSAQELLALAASGEVHSTHPIAKAILKKAEVAAPAQHPREIAGQGIEATYQGKQLLLGNGHLLAQVGLTVAPVQGTVVHVALDGKYKGFIELGDRLKATSKQTVATLQASHIQVVLLSGDTPCAVEKTAQATGIGLYYAGLMPAGKMQILEDFMRQTSASKRTAFVGDGMNDAPVLKRADVGIAMGVIGTDAAMQAADVVLMGDEPAQLITALGLARYTLRVIKQNVGFALGVKIIVLGLGVMGLANMWMAVFADVGVSLLAVLNSLRPLYYNPRD